MLIWMILANIHSTLAEEVIKGVEAAGAIAKPYQIQETLPAEVLQKMHADGSLKPKYPVIDALTKPQELEELDGFLLGAPTRYGRLPAQVSAFFDTTGQLWATGALTGKFASTFTSTASQHGGQETTHLTTIPFFAHHGIIYVPIGYTQPYLTDLTDIHGGSAYGISTVAAADGSRTPTQGELQMARYQGEVCTPRLSFTFSLLTYSPVLLQDCRPVRRRQAVSSHFSLSFPERCIGNKLVERQTTSTPIISLFLQRH